MTVINLHEVFQQAKVKAGYASTDDQLAAEEYLLMNEVLAARAQFDAAIRRAMAKTNLPRIKEYFPCLLDAVDDNFPAEVTWSEAIERAWGYGSMCK